LEKNKIHAPFSFLINEELWLPFNTVGVLDGDQTFLTTHHYLMVTEFFQSLGNEGVSYAFEKPLTFFFGKPSLKVFQNHMTCPLFLATKKLQLPLDKGGSVDGNRKNLVAI
jgi:hypothetical protein